MIRLGTRISLAGGAEAITRLVATALGLALGVGLLLYAAATFPALHAHDVRGGWYATSAHNHQPAQDEATTDPLLWRLVTDHFQGRVLIRVDLAAEGPRAPLPPGLTRLPGPGQLAVSPALARLLRTTDKALLGNRFPGQVTATVGPAALVAPDDLVVFAGHTPAELRAQPGVTEVRSIEAAPVSHSITNFLRVILVIGSVGLIVPVVVFVSTATRLAAARREQRLAALRLVGATPQQTAAVAGVEAALSAVAGTAIGATAFFATRPVAAGIPFDGSKFFVADFRLPLLWTAVIVLGVPALSIAAAIRALHGVNVSPLGVMRGAAAPRPPSARSLVPLVAGLVLLAVALAGAAGGRNQGLLAVGGLAFAVVIVGIMLAGPWLTARLAAAMARVARRPPLLLAARRLHENPSAGFRSISGLVVAAFVTSVFSGLTPAVVGQASTRAVNAPRNQVFATLMVLTEDNGDGIMAPDRAATLLHTLAATRGVTRVVDFRQPPPGLALPSETRRTKLPQGLSPGHHRLALVRCADLVATALTTCPAHAATAVTYVQPLSGGQTIIASPQPARQVPAATLATLPLEALVATTDGSAATIERVRTIIETSAPATAPVTDADVRLVRLHLLTQLQRLSNVGLLLALLVAGCSLAIAVSAGLIERKRPFALLRLSGVPVSSLNRVVLAEAAAPLLLVAAASAGLGLGVAAMILKVVSVSGWHPPAAGYWYALAAGISFALLTVVATLPLLKRVTSLETARFE